MPGIDQQIQEYLVELRRQTADARQVAVIPDHFGLVLELVPDDVQRAIQALVQVGEYPIVAVEFAGTGEVAQIVNDLLDPLDALARLGQQLRQVGLQKLEIEMALLFVDLGEDHRIQVRVRPDQAVVVVEQGQQRRHIGKQGAQVGMHVADRVVDLVRYPGGQLPDRGHLLRLQQLVLRFLELLVGAFQFDVAVVQGLFAPPLLAHVAGVQHVMLDAAIGAQVRPDFQTDIAGHRRLSLIIAQAVFGNIVATLADPGQQFGTQHHFRHRPKATSAAPAQRLQLAGGEVLATHATVRGDDPDRVGHLVEGAQAALHGRIDRGRRRIRNCLVLRHRGSPRPCTGNGCCQIPALCASFASAAAWVACGQRRAGRTLAEVIGQKGGDNVVE